MLTLLLLHSSSLGEWVEYLLDRVLTCTVNFSYNYSAKENEEIQAIRKRYLPQEETKLDELRRLDEQVRKSGTAAALCVGIINSLIFGLGMCLAMQVVGNGIAMMILGIVVQPVV